MQLERHERSAPLNNSGPVHTVFSAECNPTFDWHSVALFHSHAKSGQPGGITRLLACEPAKLRTYRGLDIGPTFVHHNHRGKKGMNYAAFNKPASVYYWVRSGRVPPGVVYVMQLDADMLIHRPVDPAALGVKYGTVLSAPYDYLVGTTSGLADVFGVRNKSLQARCGGMHVFHIDDLRRIAPLWLHFTEEVREFACREPERYYRLASPRSADADDSSAALGRRRQFMWMVEMYGYVFGAAEAGVPHHIVKSTMMAYAGDIRVAPGPYILHYGIDWEVGSDKSGDKYGFNKLNYMILDPPTCPHWFFPVPKRRMASYRDRVCVSQIVTFNEALCGYYGRHCTRAPTCPPPTLEEGDADGAAACVDHSAACLSWAQGGECERNPTYMEASCRQSCGRCADGQLVFVGSHTTCRDRLPAGECAAAAARGACGDDDGVGEASMQEDCRKTCALCSAEPYDKEKEEARRKQTDTADHTCQDGTDLGGGHRLDGAKPRSVAEVDAALGATLEDDDDAASSPSPPPSPPPTTTTSIIETIDAPVRQARARRPSTAAAHEETPQAAAAAEHGELLRTVAAAREAEAEARRQLDELQAAQRRLAAQAQPLQAQPVAAARLGPAPRTPHAGSRSEEISALDSMSIVVVAAEGAALFVAGYAVRGFVDRQRRRRRADRLGRRDLDV